MRNAQGKPFNPPSFSHVYKLSAVKEENSKGSWWGLQVEKVEPVGDAELYAKAKAFHNSVSAGEVEVAPPQADVEAAGSEDRF
jgi:hypothetical protein